MVDVDGYPVGEPHDGGMLDVGDGHRLAWTVSGRPDGVPAVLLHGGPGSGADPAWRRFLDPDRYRIVQHDQRGCGRSTPSAADPVWDPATVTTPHLLADLDRLREHLRVERWLVLGGSWGSTLALAHAQTRPERVRGLVLFAVATTSRREVEWLTRDVGRVFPREHEAFRAAVPAAERDGDPAAAYARLLASPDPAVHGPAAAAWCAWEDAHVSLAPGHRPSRRFADPRFRLGFARLVTRFWAHAGFLDDVAPDGDLVAGAHRLAGVPGVLVHGRHDVSSPLETAWRLHRAWPGSDLVVVDAGHGGDAFTAPLVAATDRFAES